MKVHFIGIGGIGVSALAQFYLLGGHQVSGSDLVSSEITDFMKEKGVKVLIGQKPENITPDIDLVIYSPAVKSDNPEFAKSKGLGIKMQSYPESLGDLTKQYYTIAVSGAHGKSTTTSMMALVLIEAGLDPTVVVGTKLKEFDGSNFRMGDSKYLVIEACEYDSSFLHYQPKVVIVTNIDKEHLDYFKTFANVKKAFKDFMAKVPAGGFLYFNRSPSMRNKDAKNLKKILKVPGEHNVYNALAALAVARFLKIPDQITFNALSKFTGTWRRFEEIQPKTEKFKNLKIISDYGHHPNEIKATFSAARKKFPKQRIWCIFQPHQHQRTHYLFNDFVKTFRSASASRRIDKIIITDIYDVAGREAKKISAGVSSEKLVNKIARKNVNYLPIAKAEKFLKENLRPGDVLIIMGAGDIYKLVEKF